MLHHETSLSLLDQLCQSPDAGAWDRLAKAYLPLVRSWIERYQVQAADTDDLAQEVLMVVLHELPSFRHNQHRGAFRTWLRRIVANRLRNYWRTQGRKLERLGDDPLVVQLDELEDPRSSCSALWDREHDRYLVLRLLEMLESRFSESTREAFRQLVLEGSPARVVAAELGMTLNAVFTAKSRVLRELRFLGRGLID